MVYATQADLTERFGTTEITQLTDRAGTGQIDAAVAGQALADAADTIDGYLGFRYDLPLAAPPPVLTRLACDIARYYLYDEAAPEQIQKRYDAAMKLLAEISAGKVSLGLPESDEPAAAGSPDYDAPARVFTRESLRDY